MSTPFETKTITTTASTRDERAREKTAANWAQSFYEKDLISTRFLNILHHLRSKVYFENIRNFSTDWLINVIFHSHYLLSFPLFFFCYSFQAFIESHSSITTTNEHNEWNNIGWISEEAKNELHNYSPQSNFSSYTTKSNVTVFSLW